MNDEATDQLEQAEEAPPNIKSLSDDREAILAEIAKDRSDSRMAAEEAVEATGGEPATEGQAAETVPEQINEIPEPEPILVEEDGQTFIALKVDGVDRRMPIEDARAELQRRESGSQRLQEAARQNVENRRSASELAERERLLSEQPSRQEPPAETSEERRTRAKDLVVEILNGDEDTAADKLATMMERVESGARPATGVDESVIAAAVQKARRDQDDQHAFNQFLGEFPDILPGTDAFAFADMKSTEVVAEHPEWSVLAVMREAGRRTRTFRGTPEPGDTKLKTSGRNEAHAARDKLTRMPPAGSVSEELVRETPKRKTVEDTVDEMNFQRRGKRAYGVR